MKFEWDAIKAASNKTKHGVSFDVATRVFFDPCRIETHDLWEDYGEDRWATLGIVDPAVLYVVIRFVMATLSESFQREKPMKKNASNTVKLTLDPGNLPPLTAQQRAELDAIAALPDEAIDYSDAPLLNEAFWQAVNLPATAQKTQITLRIDSDVVEFFKHTGKRYQTKINAVLRAYVEAHKKAHS